MYQSPQFINSASDKVLKRRTHNPARRPQRKLMSGELPSAAARSWRPGGLGDREVQELQGSPGFGALRKMDVTVEVGFKI